ncbi:MAG: hypothetical protein KF805_14995 [Phycisphaeraceae bacterium]|nr:hypothetical protein [Phycisphaeraceae bacterium]
MVRGRTAGSYFEQWHPPAIGLLAAAIVAMLNLPSDETYKVISKALPSVVDAAAIFAGFQGTAIALLFTLAGSEPLKILKRQGKSERLASFIMWAFVSMLALVVAAILVQSIQAVYDDFGTWASYVAAFVVFFLVFASLCAVRAIRLLSTLLMLPDLLGNEKR